MKFRSKFQAVLCVAALLSLACLILFQLMCPPRGDDLFSALRTTALTCFYHFAVRLFIGEVLIPRFDLRAIDPEHVWFRTHDWEMKLYRRLGVWRWKGKLPTYDPREFNLRRLGPEEVARSTCRAELTHELNAAASFVPLQFSRWFGAFPVFLITSIAAAAFDLAFVAIQRYNRPRLLRLAEMRRREERGYESDA